MFILIPVLAVIGTIHMTGFVVMDKMSHSFDGQSGRIVYEQEMEGLVLGEAKANCKGNAEVTESGPAGKKSYIVYKCVGGES